MSLTPETRRGELPVIEERPEEIAEVPPEVERAIPINRVPAQVAPVFDDKGQPLTQTPATEEIVITIPEPKEKLTATSKGSDEDSPTWNAKYWLRQIGKALFWGWKWVVGENRATA